MGSLAALLAVPLGLICGDAAAPSGVAGGVVGALLVAGLAGGATHCAAMCGPIVWAQQGAACRAGCRRRAPLLLPYHLGRILSYAALGAAAALAGGGLGQVPGFAWLAVVLLSVAAALFLAQALRRFVPVRGRAGGGTTFLLRAAHALATGRGGGLALGLVLGLLPCGLIYAALAAAAATGAPALGAAAMAAFAIGTVPGLAAVAWIGRLAGRRWGAAAERAAPLLMLLNAALLAGFAWRLAPL